MKKEYLELVINLIKDPQVEFNEKILFFEKYYDNQKVIKEIKSYLKSCRLSEEELIYFLKRTLLLTSDVLLFCMDNLKIDDFCASELIYFFYYNHCNKKNDKNIKRKVLDLVNLFFKKYNQSDDISTFKSLIFFLNHINYLESYLNKYEDFVDLDLVSFNDVILILKFVKKSDEILTYFANKKYTIENIYYLLGLPNFVGFLEKIFRYNTFSNEDYLKFYQYLLINNKVDLMVEGKFPNSHKKISDLVMNKILLTEKNKSVLDREKEGFTNKFKKFKLKPDIEIFLNKEKALSELTKNNIAQLLNHLDTDSTSHLKLFKILCKRYYELVDGQ